MQRGLVAGAWHLAWRRAPLRPPFFRGVRGEAGVAPAGAPLIFPGASAARLHDAGSGHALAIAECTALPRRARQSTFYVPCWIGGEIDLADAERRRRRSRDVRDELRRICKHRLHYTVSCAPHDILRFYDEMYCPYVRTAFDRCAFMEPRSNIEAKLRCSEILIVHQEGRPCAGHLMRYEDGTAYAWLLGVMQGDRGHVRNGAIAAIYHFSLAHLAERGYTRADIGESRPFLHDGVLRYKAKWGLRLRVGTPKWFAFSLVRSTAGASAFLERNPFVYESQGALYAACFCPSGAGATADALDRLKIDGIEGVDLFRRAGGGWAAAGFRRWQP